jgi:hypothetical protein
LQVCRRECDTSERAENRFGRLIPNHAFIARQQEDGGITAGRENETWRPERCDRLESHGHGSLESGYEPATQPTVARSSAKPEFRRQRARTTTRRGDVRVNLCVIWKRDSRIGRELDAPGAACGRERQTCEVKREFQNANDAATRLAGRKASGRFHFAF